MANNTNKGSPGTMAAATSVPVRMLKRASTDAWAGQSLWILVFWLLDCKKKILSQKFIIHKQVFGMSLKEGILFIFFLTLYHWGYDVSDGLSN